MFHAQFPKLCLHIAVSSRFRVACISDLVANLYKSQHLDGPRERRRMPMMLFPESTGMDIQTCIRGLVCLFA